MFKLTEEHGNAAPTVRVVARLRLAFALIVVFMILGMLVGGFQLLKLKKSQDSAVNQSVPALINSQLLESQLSNLFSLSERFRREIYYRNAKLVFDDIQALQKDIEDSVAGQLSKGLLAPSFEELLLQVELLAQNLEELMPIRLEIITNNESLQADSRRVNMARVAFVEIFENRTVENATVLSYGSNQVIAEELRKKLNNQSDLAELYIRVSTVIDMTENLLNSSNNSTLIIDTSRIQNNLKIATQLLLALDQGSFRKDIAIVIRRLHMLIYGEHGIVDKMELRGELLVRSVKVRSRQRDIGRNISDLNEYIVASTRQHITTVSTQFSTALFRTIVLILVTGVAMLAVILFTIYYVIERQFNQRIYKLTDAVLGIAAGDVYYEVGVEGEDEIGLIASALSVFKENAKKLMRSNRDLEQFAYAASHDLRSPLRAIENLAQWTIEDAGETLSVDSRSNLTKLVERARRLSTLQTDLLEYSKAGLEQEEDKLISMSEMMQDLSKILDPAGNYPVKVSNGDRKVRMQTTPLRQILLNLYNNAIKHHDEESGQLCVEVSYGKVFMQILFTDDGPGIEPKYHAQVFELFKRLQSQDIVEGSGLGLSLVRKLVERQGGHIDVISDPSLSRGCTFKFDWPFV